MGPVEDIHGVPRRYICADPSQPDHSSARLATGPNGTTLERVRSHELSVIFDSVHGRSEPIVMTEACIAAVGRAPECTTRDRNRHRKTGCGG